MTIVDKIKELCKRKNTNLSSLELELGFGKGTIYKWDKSSPSIDKLSKVASFFELTMDEFLKDTPYNQTYNKREIDNSFTEKDKKDIAKTMNELIEQLNNDREYALMFDGEALDEETRELFKASLLNSIKLGKHLAKQKYTPKKYKK
ncbi:MAG: helix-turn-helix domain-containing protein [Lachnospirales bacterium]